MYSSLVPNLQRHQPTSWPLHPEHLLHLLYLPHPSQSKPRPWWPYLLKLARVWMTLAMRVRVLAERSSGYSCIRSKSDGDMTAGHRKRRNKEALMSRSLRSRRPRELHSCRHEANTSFSSRGKTLEAEHKAAGWRGAGSFLGCGWVGGATLSGATCRSRGSCRRPVHSTSSGWLGAQTAPRSRSETGPPHSSHQTHKAP